MTTDMNENELEFTIFCIENIADKLKIDSEVIFEKLNKSDIIKGYIVPEYEMLHTQSKEYIIEELIEVMKERGVLD